MPGDTAAGQSYGIAMQSEAELETYWVTWPGSVENRGLMGIGVTAYSREDAFALIAQFGVISPAQLEDADVHVREGVTVADLDQNHVVPGIGPLQFRGVWYPCMNIGYGAP